MLTMMAGFDKPISGSGATGRLLERANVNAILRVGPQAELALTQLKQTGRTGSHHAKLRTMLHAKISHAGHPRRIAHHFGYFSVLVGLQALKGQHEGRYRY